MYKTQLFLYLMEKILFPFDFSAPGNQVKSELTCPVVLISRTFLGNDMRNYYGQNPPDKLDVIWKTKLGTGTTIVGSQGETRWSGSGWTGQPLLIEHAGELYLIQGAFDHNLKKIKAQNGEIVWQYRFDDIIKGTGTAVCMPWIEDTASSVAIIQGSRLGVRNTLRSPVVPSLRAVSFFTGEELWRFDIKKTRSYSRDADGSGLLIGELFYIGLENGIFTVLNPDPSEGEMRQEIFQPQLIGEILLFDEKDIERHGGNLVIESSVSRIGDVLYVTAGSGHVFGIDIKSLNIVWDFYIGSDLDGSPVVTYDSCLLVTVEKQYISGRGGVLKLDPSKEPESSVVWYFPTENRRFGDWQGGVIGSCAVNDYYRENEDPALAAFVAIDGNVYVVRHDEIDTEKGKVAGPDGIHLYDTPVLLFKDGVEGGIATPLLFSDRLIVACYGGVFLYAYNSENNFTLLDRFESGFESTPVVWDRRVYVGSRDGYLYCLGEN